MSLQQQQRTEKDLLTFEIKGSMGKFNWIFVFFYKCSCLLKECHPFSRVENRIIRVTCERQCCVNICTCGYEWNIILILLVQLKNCLYKEILLHENECFTTITWYLTLWNFFDSLGLRIIQRNFGSREHMMKNELKYFGMNFIRMGKKLWSWIPQQTWKNALSRYFGKKLSNICKENLIL